MEVLKKVDLSIVDVPSLLRQVVETLVKDRPLFFSALANTFLIDP
jgi:hypothetical protein